MYRPRTYQGKVHTHSLLIILLILLIAGRGEAQTTIIVGSGTGSTYYAPFNNFYRYSYNEEIYTAAELNHTAGCITQIAYYCQSGYNYGLVANIYMGTTSRTRHNSSTDWQPQTQLTQVVSNRTIYFSSTTSGWVTINLDTPFPYDGVSNLVIAVAKAPTSSFSYTSSLTFRYSNGSNATLYRQNDSYNEYAEHPHSSAGTLTDYRADIRLTFNNGGNCPSNRQGHDTIYACGSYLWNGQTYTQTGVYQVNLPTASGEDSTAFLHLYLTQAHFTINSVEFPELCGGTTDTVEIGFRETADINLHSGTYALTVTDTIFLPDGVDCSPFGCSYRSPVTFTDFRPNSTVRNSNDIFYVRLKMEHTYVGDIHINLTCPNGNKADILNFGGSANSSCAYSIPSSSRGWQSGSNASSSYDFGIPNTNDNTNNKCDAGLNPPGEGWNYCWSNNSTQGYHYASGSTTPSNNDLIYRSSHVHNSSFDSSNVAQKTNFYTPDDNFSSLVGCPLNGDWYIEVIDGWGVDNGYLFEWELVLNPELLPPAIPNIVSTSIEGPYVTQIADSSFFLAPPSSLTNDTLAEYLIMVEDDMGCIVYGDASTFFHPTYHYQETLSICQNQLPYHWRDTIFRVGSTSGNYTFHRTTVWGCDSIVDLVFHVKDSSSTIEEVKACNQYTWHGETYTSSTNTPTYTTTTSEGCDSTITLHLTILTDFHSDTSVSACDSFTWHGRTFSSSTDTASFTTTTQMGCDSTTTLHLTIRHSSSATIDTSACDSFSWHGETYTSTTNEPTYSTTNSQGCDSTATLHLSIRHSTSATVDTSACDSFSWHGQTYSSSTNEPTYSTTNSQGCDSTTYLHLIIRYSTSTTVDTSACDFFTWNRQTYTSSTNEPTFSTTNSQGCDSTATLHLTIRHSSSATVDTSACNSFSWHGQTYTSTTNEPTYSTTNSQGCDSTATLHLTIRHTTSATVDTSACDSFSWHGQTYTSSTNEPTYSTTNSQGCDSTTYLHLTIRYSTSTTVDTSACDFFTWNRQTYTSSTNEPTYSTTNSQGCDSTATLHLTIRHSTSTTVDTSACDFFTWNRQTYTSSTNEPTYSTTNSQGCDSTATLHLTIRHSNSATVDTSACNSFLWHGETYTSSTNEPTYSTTNSQGCDSTATLHLTIRHTTSATVDTSACDSFSWHGQTYSSSTNEPTYSTTNSQGCDSTTYLHLTIRYSTSTTVDTSACDFFTWNRQTYTSSTNEPTFVTTNSQGCDSTATLHLTIRHTTSATVDTSACDSFLWHGETYTSSTNEPTYSTTNSQGCDSTATLHLTIRHTTSATVDTSACDSFSWHGQTYSSSTNEPTFVSTNSQGCDSTTYLHLTIRYSTSTTIDTSACDFFTWNRQTYTSSTNEPTFVTTNSQGCDSTATLHLTIHNSYDIHLYDTICNDSVLVYKGISYSSAGAYPLQHQTIQGCDSIVTLHLTVHAVTYATISENIVENQLPWTFNGHSFSDNIENATIVITNTHQCDSIINYSLHIYNNYHIDADSAICDNLLPMVWNGLTFTQSGTQTAILQSLSGSDSIINMTLTALPTYNIHTSDTICDDSTLTFSGTQYNTTGTYTHQFTSEEGCDSLSTLHLTVHQTYEHDFFDTICSNQSLHFADSTHNTAGIYPHHLTSQHLCDSTAILHLTVHQVTHSTACDTIVENQLPFTFNNRRFTDSTTNTIVTIANAQQCDSVIYYTLFVYWNVHSSADSTICDSQLPLQWNRRTFLADSHHSGQTYTETQNDTLVAHTGADSILTMRLTIHPTFDIHQYDTIFQDQTFTFEGHTYNTTGIYPFSYTTTFGCDSSRTLNLQVNQRSYLDSTICRNKLPFIWNQICFTDAGTDSTHLPAHDGSDSLIIMHLTVRDTSATYLSAQSCDSYIWPLNNQTYTTSTTSPFVTYSNSQDCDSVVHLNLTIDYSYSITDHIESCNPIVWIDGNTYAGNIHGPTHLLTSVAGCDSLVTLDLSVSAPTYEERLDSFCAGTTYLFETIPISAGGIYYDTLKTTDNCDSIIRLTLKELPTPIAHIEKETFCESLTYRLHLQTNLPIFYWSSFPDDPNLPGHENDIEVSVSPSKSTTYSIYADYRTEPLCPITDTIRLVPLVKPQAEIHLSSPQISWDLDQVVAIDYSTGHTLRQWYIGNDFSGTEQSITYKYQDTPFAILDTVWFTLIAINDNCQDTTIQPLAIHRPSIIVPNVFTPGVIGDNQFFQAKGVGITSFHLVIYTREGQLVFESNDINEGWDGTHNGEPCPQAAYTYHIRYQDATMRDADHTLTGTILLLR